MNFVGERKAVAAAMLALYALLFLLVSLVSPEPALVPYMAAMAAVYGTGFFALVAGYFWARWFAVGIGLYGLGGGALGLWQLGADPTIVFYAVTHGLISAALWNRGVAAQFDGRTDWRDRYHMDDNATHRLGKAVIRVGISLPVLLAYGLVPRESTAESLLAIAAVSLVGFGCWGLLRLRTWGLLVLIAGAAAVMVSAIVTPPVAVVSSMTVHLFFPGAMAAALLVWSVGPFIGPIISYMRR